MISELKAALAESPDNLGLRCILLRLLMQEGAYADACSCVEKLELSALSEPADKRLVAEVLFAGG